MKYCIIHEEEEKKVKATGHDEEYGSLCGECLKEIQQSRGWERHNQTKYDYACGYKD